MMDLLEYLSWDSDFFGIKIGKINFEGLSLHELEEALGAAKSEKYRLIYCFSTAEHEFDDDLLAHWNGTLVDEKVVFSCINLTADKPNNNVESISQDCRLEDIERLKELALISGQYSRFNIDKNFPVGSFKELYHIWIRKSVSRKISDNVYAIREKGVVKGIMTVTYMQYKTVIGLIAVSPEVQGKGFGSDLIRALKTECLEKSIPRIEVATQSHNSFACSFYERNNFLPISKTKVFHFWN